MLISRVYLSYSYCVTDKFDLLLTFSVLCFLDEFPGVDVLGPSLSFVIAFDFKIYFVWYKYCYNSFWFVCFHFTKYLIPSFYFRSVCVFPSEVSLLSTTYIRVLFCYPFHYHVSFDGSS